VTLRTAVAPGFMTSSLVLIRAEGSALTLFGHVIGSAIQASPRTWVVFSIAGAWEGA
jgi:hypothetical protein